MGDVDQSGGVFGSDVNLTKAQQSKPLTDDTSGNFYSDVNASGVITGSDVNIIKGMQSTFLPEFRDKTRDDQIQTRPNPTKK